MLKGYQADIDFANTLHRDAVRGARRGASSRSAAESACSRPTAQARSAQTGTADELKAIIKVNDWNQFHVIARGNTLIHILNGHVTAISSTTS